MRCDYRPWRQLQGYFRFLAFGPSSAEISRRKTTPTEVSVSFSSVMVSGGDHEVIGRDLHLDADNYQIIGVLPEKIEGLYPKVEIWVPAVFDPESLSPKYR